MPRNANKLSKEKILSESLILIEKLGLSEFSLRSLAANLKVQPMSIYHHFQNRNEILNGVLSSVLTEIQFLNISHNWEERLRFTAQEWLRFSKKYPNFYPQYVIQNLNTPNALHLFEKISLILSDSGLSKELTEHYLKIIIYFLKGSGLDENHNERTFDLGLDVIIDGILNSL